NMSALFSDLEVSMRRSLRHLLLLVFITSLVIYGTATSAQNPLSKPQVGSISGKVTLKGKAAQGVTVTIRNGRPTDRPTKATTDIEGVYHLNSLPSGTYQVNALAPSYVSQTNLVVLTDGENVDGINFSIVKGGVITGRVTDGDNKPVVEE